MKLTELKQLIREEVKKLTETQKDYEKVSDLFTQISTAITGIRSRLGRSSAGIRMALEKLTDGYDELRTAIKEQQET